MNRICLISNDRDSMKKTQQNREKFNNELDSCHLNKNVSANFSKWRNRRQRRHFNMNGARRINRGKKQTTQDSNKTHKKKKTNKQTNKQTNK